MFIHDGNIFAMENKLEKTSVEQQGKVFLPKRIRDLAGILPGEELVIQAQAELFCRKFQQGRIWLQTFEAVYQKVSLIRCLSNLFGEHLDW